MDILVDYNNVLQHERHHGVEYVLDKISSTIGRAHLGGASRMDFRLDGGWYEQRVLTRGAQRVATDLLACFPTVRFFRESGVTAGVLVNAELAYSIKFDPSCHLWHTFRPKGMPQGLVCEDPVSLGCTSPTCPLLATYSFFLNQACPEAPCTLTPENLLHRNEQKLVDTMVAADIFYNAYAHVDRLAVVSSDDDMWPAIKTALQLGSTVLHIHTRPGHSTSPHYAQGLAGGYIQLHL